ncbi:jg8250 [Pararge aegeria aegeria]|uniref:Jg8250 protein n=1 Tax=Pararge aegeria aegeria TaxID=348720 RepID=A0A8S4RRR8_9NEOP|nr:jg8250 [Pararge aegeria aegeria]
MLYCKKNRINELNNLRAASSPKCAGQLHSSLLIQTDKAVSMENDATDLNIKLKYDTETCRVVTADRYTVVTTLHFPGAVRGD